MKKLLLIFSLVGVFGAVKPMNSERQYALSTLENRIEDSDWLTIIADVKRGDLASSDICKYDTAAIREKLRTGKDKSNWFKNQTLFQSLLIEAEDGNPSWDRLYSLLEAMGFKMQLT